MSSDPTAASVPPVSTPTTRGHVGWAMVAVLVLLAAIGVGVTNFSPQYGYHYWLAMVPVFAFVNLLTSWTRVSAGGGNVGSILLAQGLHWAGALAAIYVIFLLFDMNWLSDQEAGVMALLVLALSAFLAGVHTDWYFCVVGLALGGIVVSAVLVQELVWMLAVPLGVAAIAGALWWWASHSRRG
jgi:hypothetical protein